jgi:hypothetical protein
LQSYKGQFKDDFRHGYGITSSLISGEVIYRGQFVNDFREGFGVSTEKNRAMHYGKYKDD